MLASTRNSPPSQRSWPIDTPISTRSKPRCSPDWKLADLLATHAAGAPLSNALVDALAAVVRDVSRRRNWRDYRFIEDMTQDAMLTLVRDAKRFRPGRGGARRFVELVVTSAFIKTVRREKREYAARLRVVREAGALTEGEADWLARYEAS